MADATGPMPSSLPYPHTRNDCISCRERDADVHVLGEEFNLPGKRPPLLCQQCLGPWAVVQMIYCHGWGRTAIEFEPSPGWQARLGGQAPDGGPHQRRADR